MAIVTYKNEVEHKRDVYFSGSTTVQEGWLVCYDRDKKTGGSADGAWNVIKPADADLKYFAGVVDAGSHGKKCPSWITINEPGSGPGAGNLVKMRVHITTTAETTLLGIVGSTFDAATGTSAAPVVAMAMETGGTTAGALVLVALKRAEQAVAVAHTNTNDLAKESGATTGTTVTLKTVIGTGASGHDEIAENFANLAAQHNLVRADIKSIIVNMKKSGLMAI